MKVLLLSQRRIATLVAYCLAYEFEDVFAAVTDAQRIDVTGLPALERSRRAYKLMRLITGSAGLTRSLVPTPQLEVQPEGEFDLFFPVFSHSYELYSLAALPGWRRRCRKGACYIIEIGSGVLPGYLIELLSSFDHIFLGTARGIEDIARITGRPCTYLPLAVDVPRFAPASADAPRPIYLANVGRRSTVTHEAMLKDADARDAFYYYDTVAASGDNLKHRTFRVDNPQEHRRMFANILKRSKYFIANRGYVNNPKWAPDRDEISARFYEGAAAGAIMIGEWPRTDEFRRQFDWPDAVIHMPFNSPDVAEILGGLDSDDMRLRTLRRNNIRQASLRHDWLYRIRAVFDILDLAPTEKMHVRGQRLEQIASQIQD